ncbi:MAG: helix-turn-helix transcriptional regulator [Thermonemataceae bacterium]
MKTRKERKVAISKRVVEAIDYIVAKEDYQSDAQFAKDIDIHPQKLSDIRTGKLQANTDLIGIIVAKFPYVNVAYLFTGEGTLHTLQSLPKQVENISQETGLFQSTEVVYVPINEIEENKEYVFLAPDIAIAGYPEVYFTEENLKEIDKFRLPMLRKTGLYACYRIAGNSMQDVIQQGNWVICRLLQEDTEVTSGNLYLIATKSDGVMLKRIDKRYLKKFDSIICYSDNPLFEPFALHSDQIFKIWEVELFLSDDLRSQTNPIEQKKMIDDFAQQLKDWL